MVLEKIKLAFNESLSPTFIFKGLAPVYIAKVFSMGMWSIAIIIAARVLGPHDYGLFSVFMAVLIMAPTFFGKSLDAGTVKFYGHHSSKNPVRAIASIRAALNIKIIVGIGGSATGYFLSSSIANIFFHNPDLVLTLKMAFIGAFGLSLLCFALAVFQAKEEFLKYSILETVFHLLRVACIIGLLLVGKLTLTNIILAIPVAIYLNMILCFVLLPKGVLRSQPIDKEVVWELVKFCKWLFLADVAYIIYFKQDILILSYFKGPISVGHYTAAFMTLMLVENLANALVVVQFPAASKLSGFNEYKGYIRRSLAISSMLSVLILPMFFLAEPLMLTFFSDIYSQAVGVFRILFFGFTIRIFTHPLCMLFLSTDRPKVLAIIFGSVLFLNLFANLLLVPTYGEIGAAWVTLASRIVEGVLICLFIYSFILSKDSQVLQEIKVS